MPDPVRKKLLYYNVTQEAYNAAMSVLARLPWIQVNETLEKFTAGTTPVFETVQPGGGSIVDNPQKDGYSNGTKPPEADDPPDEPPDEPPPDEPGPLDPSTQEDAQ